jgi:uncharacterized protein (UPF0333 family)
LLKKTKGIVSLEFLFMLLIIILSISLLISTNLYFKEKLEENNFKKINIDLCRIKEKLIENNSGVLKYDVCKSKSTDNDT